MRPPPSLAERAKRLMWGLPRRPWGLWVGHDAVVSRPRENTRTSVKGLVLVDLDDLDDDEMPAPTRKRLARFIAQAPALIGSLVAEVERLAKARASLSAQRDALCGANAELGGLLVAMTLALSDRALAMERLDGRTVEAYLLERGWVVAGPDLQDENARPYMQSSDPWLYVPLSQPSQIPLWTWLIVPLAAFEQRPPEVVLAWLLHQSETAREAERRAGPPP